MRELRQSMKARNPDADRLDRLIGSIQDESAFTKNSSTIAGAFDSITRDFTTVAMPIERYYAQGTKSGCAEKRKPAIGKKCPRITHWRSARPSA